MKQFFTFIRYTICVYGLSCAQCETGPCGDEMQGKEWVIT